MNGTILLTGGTGFVGRQVMRALVERGCPIRAVIRQGRESRLDGCGDLESVRIIPDLFAENVDWWAEACDGAEIVVHLAWYAEPGEYLLSSKNLDCLSGTLNLARGAARAGVKRFIGIGTCAENDLEGGDVSVSTPLKPTTPYAAAKAAVYLSLSQWLPRQKVQFAWCRLFYLFGEGEDPRRLVPYLRARLAAGEPTDLTSGLQVRDFLDVREAGQKIASVALTRCEGPINTCSGKPVTVRELAEKIADEYGRRDLLRFGARAENLFDPPRVVGIEDQ
jgi:dTDP-6-deoxy-L-talose 4-dehydrogenase (NAD+)